MKPQLGSRTLIAAGAFALIAAVAVAFLLVRPWADDVGSPPTAPVDRVVAVNGHGLYLTCRGAGTPTVVFDAGLGDSQSVWDRVLTRVTGVPGRLCAYDRAGLGGSDPVPGGTRAVADAAEDLHALLAAAGERPPYVLVSHSIAGLIHRYYTRGYGAEVAGLVLVDTAPDDWDVYNGRAVFTSAGESLDVAAASAALRESDDLGDRPVIVVRAARTTEISQAPGFPAYWAAAQGHLADRSTNSFLVVADSNHGVPGSQPDLVAGAVRLVVEAVGRGSRLPTCASSPLTGLNGACPAPPGGDAPDPGGAP